MGRQIAVFDSKKGEIHGFRDFGQAQDFLEIEKKDLDRILDQGGGYHNGNYVTHLNIHKSNRGGRR